MGADTDHALHPVCLQVSDAEGDMEAKKDNYIDDTTGVQEVKTRRERLRNSCFMKEKTMQDCEQPRYSPF